MIRRFRFADKMTQSELVSQLNKLRDESVVKHLTNKVLQQKLWDEGYLKIYRVHGIPMQRVSEKGKEIGITAEIRINEKESEYEVLHYSKGGTGSVCEDDKG